MSRRPTDQQYMVGIPRDSEMNAFYKQLAKDNGVKVPTYIFQLLKVIFEQSQGDTRRINALHVLPLIPEEARSQSLESIDDGYSAEEMLASFGGIDEDEDTIELAAIQA